MRVKPETISSKHTHAATLRYGLITGLLITCVFILDLSQPLGVAVGVAYVPLILLSALFKNKNSSFFLAIGTSLLVIVGMCLSTRGDINIIYPIVNRVFSIMAIWITAIVLYGTQLTQTKLAAAQERLMLGWKGTGDGMWDWNIDKNEMIFSDRFKELLGYAPDEMLSNFDAWANRLHPDDKEKTLAALNKHIKSKPVYEAEYRLMMKSGEWHWFLMKGMKLFNEDGHATRVAGSLSDITWVKKASSEREALIESLVRSNAALDDFAYVASHDLKAPLRVIDNASSWLEEDLSDRLDEDSKENLTLLRNRTKRMEKLLDDLLEYSRVGRETNRDYTRQMTGNVFIKNILGLLDLPKGFRLEISTTFENIKVTLMPLQQVFLNLINNALKHHDKKSGLISLGVVKKGDWYEFTVKDDGPGIEPEFHAQVFKMFKTLKPRDEVEGSGMGLALVKKNIEHVGGKITLHSKKGEGAVFSFTWPNKEIA